MDYERKIDDLYATLDDPVGFEAALGTLQELVGASALHVLAIDTNTGQPIGGLCPATPEGHDTYVAEYAAIDPRNRYFMHDSFHAFDLNRIFDEPNYANSRVYHEFLRDHDAQVGAAVIRKVSSSTTLVFSSFRPASQPYFNGEEVNRVESIARSLFRLTRFRAVHGHATSSGTAEGCAIYLNGAQRVLNVTPDAEDELARTDAPLRVSLGRLRASDRLSNERLQDAMDAVTTGQSRMPDDIVIHDSTGQPDYILSVHAVLSPFTLDTLLMAPRVVVRFRRIARTMQMSERVLCDLFALTPTEAAITRLVCYGASPQAIAAERGVAISTVRWTIRNLLEKFEVPSQTALVAKVSRMPGVLK